MIPTCEIIIDEVRAALKAWPAQSVHCIVTSPPYFGLRDYKVKPVDWAAGSYVPVVDLPEYSYPAWRGQLGMEPDPLMFVGHIVEIFREAWRVLRNDGTLWLNFGDCYADGGRGVDSGSTTLQGSRHNQEQSRENCIRSKYKGLRPKNLMMQPARVALALQADGWILRSDIRWQKLNPMPESISDRPTNAHEAVFLFAKTRYYYYDKEAIAEPVTGGAHMRRSAASMEFPSMALRDDESRRRLPGVNPKANGANNHMVVDHSARPRKRKPSGWATTGSGRRHDELDGRYKQDESVRGDHNDHKTEGFNRRYKEKQNASFSAAVVNLVTKRNCRNVWTIPTEAYPGSHYATFPTELVRRPILAGTSDAGCCSACGTPRSRLLKKDGLRAVRGKTGHRNIDKVYDQVGATSAMRTGEVATYSTEGWRANCKCKDGLFIPCTVLDPFGGSGTVGEVALANGRSVVLIDLNPANEQLMKERTNMHQIQGVLPT